MRKILFITLLSLSINCFSQTQHEMHVEANEEYKKVDKELNSIYQKIINEYKTDSIFIDRLKKSQRLWIQFRDADLEMKYPEEDKQYSYGSSYPECALKYLTVLTKKRIEHLKIWLIGIEEGEMCTGSTKMK